MSSLPGIVAPVFTLIAMGALAIRLRLIEPAAVRGMTDFVFYTAMPGLLFASIAEAPNLRLADIAGSFLAAAIILFGAALLIARTLFAARLSRAGVFALNCVFGNTVMLGVPIVDAAYGPEGVAYLLAVIAFHSAVLLPVATLVIEADTATPTSLFGVLRPAVQGVLRNPVVVSILLAFAWRATALPLPDPLHRFLALIGPAGPPLALFCLGATLPRPTGWADWGEVSLAALCKLVLLPALVALLAWLAGVRGVAFSVVVLAASLPTGANAFLLARRFDTMMEASATTVVLSTALSLLTLTILLAWLPR